MEEEWPSKALLNFPKKQKPFSVSAVIDPIKKAEGGVSCPSVIEIGSVPPQVFTNDKLFVFTQVHPRPPPPSLCS